MNDVFQCMELQLMLYFYACSTTSTYVCLCLLLGRGLFSSPSCNGRFLLSFRQLPLIVAHVLLITRRACVFLANSLTFGFSLDLPLCLCWPKKFSTGSWHNLLLRNSVTPGIVNRYLTNSTNDLTAGIAIKI